MKVIVWMLGLNLVVGCTIYVQADVQWTTNGVAICTAVNSQSQREIVSDGSGGAIITWIDYRNGNYDIYAQRINSSGAVQWTTDGVAICTNISNANAPTILSDGSGGAIITWMDYRNGNWDIYVQRINSSGVVQWTTDGVTICSAIKNQWYPRIVSDGLGGAIITWADCRDGDNDGNKDIYAQRINSSGVVQWTTNGVAICTATNSQENLKILSDGLGGAIITWEDGRSGNYDIYVQRINSSGVVQWTTNGVAICTATNNQSESRILSDDSGGAIITWGDRRSGNWDIYVQRINSSGVVQWTTNGVAICTATTDQWISITVVSDGSGGAIITWSNNRNWIFDIYAQRINSSGVVQWTTNGVAICISASDQPYPTAVSDGLGGAIITWADYRNINIIPNNYYDIYAQRINSNGNVQWTTNGVAICTASGVQSSTRMISDDSGGAIITWTDYRNETVGGIEAVGDIYAQRISNDAPTITSITPNSVFNGFVNVDLTGTNFFTGATVKLTKSGETDITANDVTIVSPNYITCKFDLTNRRGKWNVVLTNIDGQAGSLTDSFEVKSSITNSQIDSTTDTAITIEGVRGEIKIEISANTFNKNTTLTLNSNPTLPIVTSQAEMKSANIGIEIITSESNLKPVKPIILTIGYKDSDITGLEESKLVISVYNYSTGKWISLPSKVYADLNKITATTTHFSLFQIMEYSVPTDLNNVKVYPNPFRPASNTRINFNGLTAGAVVKIYTISGEKINEVTADSTGNAMWDGKNSNGEQVASGIYLVFISDGVNKKIVKIAIER